MIRMVNTIKGNFIIISVYLPPGNEGNNRTYELIEKLKIIKSKYQSLTLLLFGDLNIKREVVKDILKDDLESLNLKYELKRIKMNIPKQKIFIY